MDYIVVFVSEFSFGQSEISASFDIRTSWGVNYTGTDSIPLDTPSNMILTVKQRLIQWATDPVLNNKTLTEDQIIVFGGPQ